MAVTKIHPVKGTLGKALAYICNPAKTDGKILVSSYGCSYETADIEFSFTLDRARDKGNNLAHHLIQSFAPGEVGCEEAHRIGQELANKILGGRYEYVIATHTDKGHIHNHIIFCAADFVDHRKYISNRRSYAQIRKENDRICKEHGLSVITPGQDKGKKYAEWDAERRGTSWKAQLKAVIDGTIPLSKDYEDFLRRMEEQGYKIKRGKYISFRAPGQERFTRAKTLGEAYTEDAITAKIAGTYRTTDRSQRKQRDGVSLLIDIENSIKAQQSAGYERWAKIQNLKQAAKTVNFLAEHDLMAYEQLASALAEIHAENEQTAAALKDVERRLSDMALLMKNVSTFQRTKPVYEAYQKAKDQSSFRREHESELIIYEATAKTLQAAKNSGRLPSVKKLQTEYKELSGQKERLYTAYAKLKKKVKQYDTIKANVDSILRRDRQPEQEREGTHHIVAYK